MCHLGRQLAGVVGHSHFAGHGIPVSAPQLCRSRKQKVSVCLQLINPWEFTRDQCTKQSANFAIYSKKCNCQVVQNVYVSRRTQPCNDMRGQIIIRSLPSEPRLGAEGGSWMTLINSAIRPDTSIFKLRFTCQESGHLDSLAGAGNTLTILAHWPYFLHIPCQTPMHPLFTYINTIEYNMCFFYSQ